MATLFTEREGGFTAQVSGHQVHNQWIVTYCPLLLKTSMLTTMSNFAVQWNQLNMFVSTSTKGSMPPLSIPEQRINVTKSPTLWSGTVWAQMRLFGDFLASPFIKAILWSCHWRCILKWTMCLFFNWNHRTNSRADKRTPYLLPSFFNCAKMSPLPRKSCTPKYHHISNGTKNTVFGESKNKANMFRDIPASSYYMALVESTQSTLTNRNASTSTYYCMRYKDLHHSKLSMNIPTQHTVRLAYTVGYWRMMSNGILWWPKLLPCIPQEDCDLIAILLQLCKISNQNSRKISHKTTSTKASCYFWT